MINYFLDCTDRFRPNADSGSPIPKFLQENESMFNQKNNSFIISYLTLRQLIGLLGFTMPFVLISFHLLFQCFCVEVSISAYYHTNMHDYFTGALAAIGFFLFTYKGYDRIDNLFATFSGIAAFGIAIFPVGNGTDPVQVLGIFMLSPAVSEPLHFLFAAIFFVALAYMAIFLFTKKDPAHTTREKKVRNRFYIGCGIVIIIAILLILLLSIISVPPALLPFKPVLILESILLISFSTSWLVKGEVLFRDK